MGTPSFHTGHSAPLFLLPASPSLGPGVGPQAATVWQSMSESGRWRPDSESGGATPVGFTQQHATGWGRQPWAQLSPGIQNDINQSPTPWIGLRFPLMSKTPSAPLPG